MSAAPSPLLGLRMSNFPRTPAAVSDRCGNTDRVKAMLNQSESTYRCNDYIRRRSRKDKSGCHATVGEGASDSGCPELSVEQEQLDTVCREKMCEWSYRVCDHFQTGREIVAVSFSLLDRFVDKCSCERSAFKLAAMTTLYMANKIYGGPQAISIGALAELSRGEFEPSHISEMEVIILKTLEWRLHPPTVQCFIDAFFHYLSLPSHGAWSVAIYERATFFAELAVYDYAFVPKRKSLIALGCLMNAMEGMDNSLSAEQQRGFVDAVNATFDLEFTTDSIESVRNRLWYVYSMSAQYKEDDAVAGAEPGDVVKKSVSQRTYGVSSTAATDLSSSPSTSPVSVAAASGPHHIAS
ncbi:unnamed protein product [Pseudo-nitzschia multistriata]|uniref:Cyclin-like domain-containing protein n=1 Tax=Pseudo-nitzschia multistriata TaxID=183589 RepID=A0A448ZEP6_9STRA|nr:unnamed protein product [Pseudo-nitzschia multistriata]